MNERDIEHMWKVASNNPNHDTNWHDPVVIRFADLVIKPWAKQLEVERKKFQELNDVAVLGMQHAREAEREACAKICDVLAVHPEYASEVTKLAALAIRARGQA